MKKRKPIDKFDTVIYKCSKENRQAHIDSPTYFPKINTEGVCTGRLDESTIIVQWAGYERDWAIEEDRVLIRRKSNV